MMKEVYVHDTIFDAEALEKEPLLFGMYEACTFRNCDLSPQDFSDFKFSDCVFEQCNLSVARMPNVSFSNTRFKECKMLGLNFSVCNPVGLSFSFEDCRLDHAIFTRLKIRKTHFNTCSLQDADFTEANLSKAVFEYCDLERARFSWTDLTEADFRTSYNYVLDPDSNLITKARFSVAGLPGLLGKYRLRFD